MAATSANGVGVRLDAGTVRKARSNVAAPFEWLGVGMSAEAKLSLT